MQDNFFQLFSICHFKELCMVYLYVRSSRVMSL